MTGPVLNTIVLNFRTPNLSIMAVEGALREMQGIAGGVTLVDNDGGGDGSLEKDAGRGAGAGLAG
ncbi:hypothetical protein PE067_11780 [Paracoccus sp. DMF-8]|uniref:hypothetical protein n=1 Tax=Paracoccus sp. DMF-8 TaxID=3019445 RepID=UPI0023E8F9BC|nr:hypothetical protein [Paracoccus sp. DMF-8]MDF3606746.1 hypothetical protein [Paracoccus sp. DMF-8]